VLGYSAHDRKEAEQALDDKTDYVTVSPIFPSLSKPELAPLGIGFLRESSSYLPANRVLALGGINGENLVEARRAGAHGAAVMGEVMRSEDPRATALAMVAAWESAGSSSE
jgi:thiamine-phosphate pyrophosphorylase